jgi:hypothetical protein
MVPVSVELLLHRPSVRPYFKLVHCPEALGKMGGKKIWEIFKREGEEEEEEEGGVRE